MKRINNITTTGFPESIESWNFIADQNLQLHKLINEIASDDTCILSGLKFLIAADNTIVSDGYICFEGKIYTVKGDIFETADMDNVRVSFSTITDPDYFNPQFQFESSTRQVYLKDVATISVSDIGLLLKDLKRVPTLTSLSPFFKGMIVEWQGLITDIPKGWVLCDGSLGTIDTRGRVGVGFDASQADYDTIGNTGGVKEVAITEAQLPSHSTTFSGTTNPTGIIESGWVGQNGGGWPDGSGDTTTPGTTNSYPRNSREMEISIPELTINGTTDSIGGDEPHENRQPYYVIGKIMYVGV